MALIVKGIDSTSGQPRKATGGEDLVDADGAVLGGGGGSPSPASWGNNVETLSADKVLTDSSETLQWLDPGGAVRTVDLPVLSASTPFFVFWNAGSGEFLSIRTASGDQVVALLNAGDAVRVMHDATDIYVEQLSLTAHIAAAQGRPIYHFGGDPAGSGYFVVPNNTALTASNENTASWLTEHIISIAGTVDEIIYRVTNADSTGVMKLWKNGSADTTFSAISSTTGVFSPSMSVVAGDQIALEFDTGTDPGATLFHVLVSPTPSESSSAYYFGANMTTVGYYMMANGDPSQNQSLTLDTQRQHPIVSPGLASSLVWTAQWADTTTDIKLWKNDAVSETIDLTGGTGLVTSLSTYFNVGDVAALEADAGTVPGTSTWALIVDGGPTVFSFGGSQAISLRYLDFMAAPLLTIAAGLDIANNAETPACDIRRAIWNRADPVDECDINFWKNGASTHTVNVPGGGPAAITVEFPVTAFAQGDSLAVRGVYTQAPSYSVITALLEIA